jgi:molybdopterin-containing oxidoreductase family membrane subunit
MSSIHPDEVQAGRLAGVIAAPPRETYPADSIDGTIVADPSIRPPLVTGGLSIPDVTNTVCGYVENKPGRWWFPTLGFTSTLAGVGTAMILYLIITGVGVWGNNNRVDWAWDITNFVFWIGIGHAGTLISAILCLLKQKWRTSINRAAEAMTIFAVICAATYPGIHVGRAWMAWMMFPLPNSNAIWPNFRSPLLWDLFAVSTYGTVSALFWFMGMIPDFATLRDRALLQRKDPNSPTVLPFLKLRACTLRAYIYGLLSLGWRFSHRHWHRYEKAYMILAGISTPLVLSVHSIVSFDFATSINPGWHTTIFPPYFVAGAIFGGFAMVLLLMIPSRELFPNMKHLITLRHLENMAKIITVTGSMVGFAYMMEFFIAYYSGSDYEKFIFINARALPTWLHKDGAPYWWAYWTMIFCNVVSPQLFWFKWARTSPFWIFVVSFLVTIGMWFERFVIIVTSLHRGFLPANWGMFYATPVDMLTFAGTFGIFLTLFLLFLKFLPAFAMSEIKNVMPAAHPHDDHAPDHHGAGASHGGAH